MLSKEMQTGASPVQAEGTGGFTGQGALWGLKEEHGRSQDMSGGKIAHSQLWNIGNGGKCPWT